MTSNASKPSRPDFAERLYRWRWPLSLLVLICVALAGSGMGSAVSGLTGRLNQLGDTAGGLTPPPVVFDPRMDIWFGKDDPAVEAYRDIEAKFVAEDYVVVAFEETEDPLGVFGRKPLMTIARLTEELLKVPGVRHVRSLTSAPWIRYGEIEGAGERGLIVSDLVHMSEAEIAELTDEDLVERMVAVLGGRKSAELVGEELVRRAIGADANLDDFIGEPLMLGTIVGERADITTIQVQVLRGRADEADLAAVFPEGTPNRAAAPALFSVQSQHASLRGIEHVLRQERGRAVPTDSHAMLTKWVDGMPLGKEKDRLSFQLADPSRNFMESESGELVRKFFELDPDGNGGWEDRSDPSNVIAGPASFQPTPRSDYDFRIAGLPTFERNFMQVGMADAKFMALVVVLITLVLFLTFRNAIGVIAPMVVVGVSVVIMLGVVQSAGDLLNNLTMISPTMLTAVGIADAIHLVAAWSVLRHSMDSRREMMIEVIRRNALPVFLTSVTTAVGFYSLTVSEIAPMGMLGYTAGLGTLAAYAVSMTLLPALLSLIPLPKEKHAEVAPDSTHKMSVRVTDWVLGARGKILAATGLVMIVTAVGMSRFTIDTDFRAMFPDDNKVMEDFHWIESRLGGIGDLEIVFNGMDRESDVRAFDESRSRLQELRLQQLGAVQASDEFSELSADELEELAGLEKESAAIERNRIGAASAFFVELEKFEKRLLDEMSDPNSPLNVVTDLTSPLDILRKMNQVQNENRAEYYRVPNEGDIAAGSREDQLELDPWSEEWNLLPGQSASSLIAQYFLQYENGARPGENLATQISGDRRFFRMQGRVKQAPTMLQQEAFDLVAEIARNEFPSLSGVVAGGPPLSDLTISGKTVLFSRTPEKFTRGFLESMGLALIVITILIALIFRSVTLAIVSIVPNLLPILIPLSFIGLTGDPLDGPAIMVASVALGVCVDDTIHFFAKFTKARRLGKSLRESMIFTYDRVGRAITTTSVVLIVGFAGLTFSDFRPNYMMGTLAIAMFFLALVADILVVPALLSYLPGFRAKRSTDTEPVHISKTQAVSA